MTAYPNLIRWGGLAAMVGGAAWALVWLVGLPFSRILWYDLLVLGAMAGTAALHALQRERYGLLGAIASLVTFLGLAIEARVWNFYVPSLGPLTGTESIQDLERQGWIIIGSGLLPIASLVVLSIATKTAQVLPWWCAAALLVGGPLISWYGGVALVVTESPFFVLLAPVPGVAWALVGLAVFRAARLRYAST